MKKAFSFLLVAMFLFCSITVFAEEDTIADRSPISDDASLASPPDSASTPPEMPDGASPADGMPGGMGGGSQTESSGTGATTLTSDDVISDAAYTSNAEDENALRIENGANVSIEDITVSKTGDSSNSDNSAFYGQNAGVLVRDGASVTITGGEITTDANGSSGIFVYGTGSASVSDVTIRTSEGNSGGVMLAGGGTLTASNLNIETQGGSSAAIRTDRGGGTMTVIGGTYVTNGIGSPPVYSTAVVSVSGATLISNNSEAVAVEGKNSVSLINCEVTGNMTTSAGGDGENLQTVLIYQSMSGDADVGRSDFAMTGGSLTSLNGDTFYVTNTSCTIELEDVQITNADGVLLKVAGNSSSRGWGQEGANGSTCDMTVTNQLLEGEIVVDEISVLNLALIGNSALTGTINSGGGDEEVTITLDDTSSWTLTADSYVTGFEGNLENVDTNGFNLYVAGEIVK